MMLKKRVLINSEDSVILIFQITKEMRVAILDLGTNTFNLVVAEIGLNRTFKIMCNNKLPVKLGEGKINEGEIIDDAYKRGIEAIHKHFNTITKLNVSRIKAFGTSALRSSSNGSSFLDEIKSTTGIEIEIIDGDREAELIFKGVRQTVEIGNEKILMLDIGGGSNELIIADAEKIYWKKSYDLGIARLLEQFKPSDPINKSELTSIQEYLTDELNDLFEEAKIHQIKTLIGASGSFETFSVMIRGLDDITTEEALKPQSYNITLNSFEELYLRLISSTIAQRRKMKGLEPMRIEMIPLAALFVKVLIDEINIVKIIQSNFALKEGALAEMLCS